MQFFSSSKKTALIFTQPNHPQMLQKNCRFGCITHWLPKKQQYTDPAATNITHTKVSWGDSFFPHLGKFSVWRLSVLEHVEVKSWLHSSISTGLRRTLAQLTPTRKGSATGNTPAPEALTDLQPKLLLGGWWDDGRMIWKCTCPRKRQQKNLKNKIMATTAIMPVLGIPWTEFVCVNLHN